MSGMKRVGANLLRQEGGVKYSETIIAAVADARLTLLDAC